MKDGEKFRNLLYPLCFLPEGTQRDKDYFTDLLENESPSGRELVLHITIPFCDSICTFCDAHRIIKTKDKVTKYLQALKTEAEIYSKTKYVSSCTFSAVYIGGGGTPTVLSSEELRDLLFHCRSCFTFSKNAEITIESTTHNLEEGKLVSLSNCGVGRIYFGVQTFNDAIRKLLNRTESSTEVSEKIKKAHELGFDIHIDLMYGLPGQNMEMWKEDLEKVIELNIESISVFRFRVYPHLRLAKMLENGEAPPIESKVAEMYTECVKVLTDNGYKRQSLWKFVMPGKESTYHDHVYKYQRERLGLGATNWFCSLLGKYFYRNHEIEEYIRSLSQRKLPISEGMKLSKTDEMRRMMLQLHFGVDRYEFKKRFGKLPEDVFPKAIDLLRKRGLISVEGQEIKLTELTASLETFQYTSPFLLLLRL